MIAGIILAAGDSRRMGSPKALLQYQGETFVARLVRIFSKFCSPVIVVAGKHADQIRAAVNAQVVVNPDPSRGQLSSLQTALVHVGQAVAFQPPVSPGFPNFLFTPVDCPTFTESTVLALLDAFRITQAPLTIPKYSAKRGHPVLVKGSLAAEFLQLAPTEETRVIINRHPIHYVDVDEPGVLADVDDPEAYRALVR